MLHHSNGHGAFHEHFGITCKSEPSRGSPPIIQTRQNAQTVVFKLCMP